MKKMNLVVILLALIILLMLSMIALVKFSPGFDEITDNTDNIAIINKKDINFESLTQRQKLSQMIIVRGDKKDLDFTNLNVGGIFLDKQNSEKDYINLINEYQENSKIDLFVTTDLEGAWFPRGLKNIFPKFYDIKTKNEAYQVGYKHGVLLNEIGFNMNFAPVSETSDIAYGGRTFNGTHEQQKEKIENYIQGLQQNVYGTCKHYPGKALQVNLHFKKSTETITKEDLDLFQVCIENDIQAVMISHHSVQGEINSNGEPSTTSPEVINTLKESGFEGLIIADEINMEALTIQYPKKRILYSKLINAGNNIILDFELNSKELNQLLKELEEDLNQGLISQEQVDNSVKKILSAKGYNVLQ